MRRMPQELLWRALLGGGLRLHAQQLGGGRPGASCIPRAPAGLMLEPLEICHIYLVRRRSGMIGKAPNLNGGMGNLLKRKRIQS